MSHIYLPDLTQEQYAVMSAFINRAVKELDEMTVEMRIRLLAALPTLMQCSDEVKRRLP